MTWKEIRERYESGFVDFQTHSHRYNVIFKNIKLLDIFSKDENLLTIKRVELRDFSVKI